jgi:hypothetical protein
MKKDDPLNCFDCDGFEILKKAAITLAGDCNEEMSSIASSVH